VGGAHPTKTPPQIVSSPAKGDATMSTMTIDQIKEHMEVVDSQGKFVARSTT